ncbi:hypothetical protein ACJX0J_026686, partial [Zea mays]
MPKSIPSDTKLRIFGFVWAGLEGLARLGQTEPNRYHYTLSQLYDNFEKHECYNYFIDLKSSSLSGYLSLIETHIQAQMVRTGFQFFKKFDGMFSTDPKKMKRIFQNIMYFILAKRLKNSRDKKKDEMLASLLVAINLNLTRTVKNNIN